MEENRMKLLNHFMCCILLLGLISCSNDISEGAEKFNDSFFYNAVDLSLLPKLRKSKTVFYDQDKKLKDALTLLAKAGVNTIRLRIWVSPESEDSSFDEVKKFSKELRSKGFKIWLTVHYSDSWADPGNQKLPKAWDALLFENLLFKVNVYTKRIVAEISPDIIQIGNEINNGFLFPHGDIYNNQVQFIELLSTGVNAVREASETCKIMIHVAGLKQADWFFSQLKEVDYDLIGISYYPKWHVKNLEEFEYKFNDLSEKFEKDILIAETAYPFTLDWNDLTHNVMGGNDALILPDYPATKSGQLKFCQKVKSIVLETKRGRGFCYWGAELVAFDGHESLNGSAWENQALFDFNNTVLPVMGVFNME
ncbi:MAG: arabinogalactan endo-1,4-beta-galactosidase [Flavobacteriaceae bacterium]|nr:MAG: arabinogalactan endo-1,4-beta-galactosidase [Flavobacteriaceae bacterium]